VKTKKKEYWSGIKIGKIGACGGSGCYARMM